MTDFGIDVSHHNRVDDWKAVRRNNITYACVKLTESTDFVDAAAATHAGGARAAGIHVGGYHFARNTDIAAQVAHFSAQLKARNMIGAGALAPMLDMEAEELRRTANTFVADFIRRLRTATGQRKVLVYANLDWYRNVLRPDAWADDDVRLWVARFNGDPGNPGFEHPGLALHQHTSKGRVPGIPGDVDRDATVGQHRLASVLQGNGAAPVPDTYVVKAGDTLSEIAREHHTTVAALVRLNNIPDPDRIFPGQVLRLR
jgi:GH25 family lysozyme M1 (1,4-beta-N-acetylmuramidase)